MIMNVDEIVNEMTMSYSHSMHLIVEGETDKKFFTSVIKNNEFVNVMCANGSDGAIDVISSYEKYVSPNGINVPALGIIDRDYRFPIGKIPQSTNILLTDSRDLECMMIGSSSLMAVFNELGSANKIRKFGNEAAIRQKLISACKVVGELRYFSQSTNINLTFQKLDFEKFVDKKTLVLDHVKFVNHLAAAQPTGTTRVTVTCLANASNVCGMALHPNGQKYFINDLLVCCGHDLTALISLGLKSLWGSRTNSELTTSIEGYLRLSYLSNFSFSNLHASILTWIAAHNLQLKVVI